ncbi:MAG TPA: hypothetical protein VK629_12650 [Steroidobacteraceae bacterium]|nr:hypothetical protein [Steroidobacteraceae bacterium]
MDHAGYKEQGLGPEEMETFELEEPTPEKRDRYWEFEKRKE